MASPSAQRQLSIDEQIKDDFAIYWEAAQKDRLDEPEAHRVVIASANKYAVCFSYFSRAMTVPQLGLEPHQRVFFQELTSDAVHLVHALIGGDARGGRFYLRSIVENFWRHHYFRDHVVEYGWLHTRDKYHLEMKQLKEHCSWLDCFQGDLKPLLTNLPHLYSVLSNAVHSTSSRTLVLRQSLGDIRLVKEHIQDIHKDVLDTLKVCLALCIYSEKSIFGGFKLEVQQYLLDSLSADQRAIIKSALEKDEG